MEKESLETNNLGETNSLPAHFDKFFNYNTKNDEESATEVKKELPNKVLLNIKYHNQINNEILPYSTCGPTTLSEYINYINDVYKKDYVCDDDQVFLILNSKEVIDIAKKMVKDGKLDPSALTPREDKLNTKINENSFLHLNNFSDMLAVLGTYLTNNEFEFKTMFLTIDEIKQRLANGFPVITSGKFTAGGHYIIFIGYDNEKNVFICDDPYGNFNKKYESSTLGKGQKMEYSIPKILEIATIKGKNNSFKCVSLA